VERRSSEEGESRWKGGAPMHRGEGSSFLRGRYEKTRAKAGGDQLFPLIVQMEKRPRLGEFLAF
jgi:hypothetical protein